MADKTLLEVLKDAAKMGVLSEQVEFIRTVAFRLDGNVGTLDWHIGRLGLVCYYNTAGYISGTTIDWVQSSGAGYSPKSVGKLVKLFLRVERNEE